MGVWDCCCEGEGEGVASGISSGSRKIIGCEECPNGIPENINLSLSTYDIRDNSSLTSDPDDFADCTDGFVLLKQVDRHLVTSPTFRYAGSCTWFNDCSYVGTYTGATCTSLVGEVWIRSRLTFTAGGQILINMRHFSASEANCQSRTPSNWGLSGTFLWSYGVSTSGFSIVTYSCDPFYFYCEYLFGGPNCCRPLGNDDSNNFYTVGLEFTG